MKRLCKKIRGFTMGLCIFIVGLLIIRFLEMDDDSSEG
jgi:hypothetical protein